VRSPQWWRNANPAAQHRGKRSKIEFRPTAPCAPGGLPSPQARRVARFSSPSAAHMRPAARTRGRWCSCASAPLPHHRQRGAEPVRPQPVRHHRTQGRHGARLRLLAAIPQDGQLDLQSRRRRVVRGRAGTDDPGQQDERISGRRRRDVDDLTAYLATQK